MRSKSILLDPIRNLRIYKSFSSQQKVLSFTVIKFCYSGGPLNAFCALSCRSGTCIERNNQCLFHPLELDDFPNCAVDVFDNLGNVCKFRNLTSYLLLANIFNLETSKDQKKVKKKTKALGGRNLFYSPTRISTPEVFSFSKIQQHFVKSQQENLSVDENSFLLNLPKSCCSFDFYFHPHI